MTDNTDLNKVWFDLENARWTLSQASDLIAAKSRETLKRAEVTLYALGCVIERLNETHKTLDAVVSSLRSLERRKALEENSNE